MAMTLHRRMVWYVRATTGLYALLALGILVGPERWWSSPTLNALKEWMPMLGWATIHLAIVVLCLLTLISHARRGPVTAVLLRMMTSLAATQAAAWTAAFVAGLTAGTLAGFSALPAWLFITLIHLEAASYGGRPE